MVPSFRCSARSYTKNACARHLRRGAAPVLFQAAAETMEKLTEKRVVTYMSRSYYTLKTGSPHDNHDEKRPTSAPTRAKFSSWRQNPMEQHDALPGQQSNAALTQTRDEIHDCHAMCRPTSVTAPVENARSRRKKRISANRHSLRFQQSLGKWGDGQNHSPSLA